MTRIAVMPILINKEIRALLLPWLACVAAMVAGAMGGGRSRGLGIVAYIFGAAALGALSIGSEYSHRTLAIVLSQPVRRERLFLTKLAVLLSMLVLLRAVADFALFDTYGRPSLLHIEFGQAALWLPVAWGLAVAPWLTMLSRSPIAGAVFTAAIPGTLLVTGELLGVMQHGLTPEADRFRLVFFWGGTLALCATGALMGPRTFMRLEVIDGRAPHLRLPQWLRFTGAAVTPARPANPLWLLIKKELHLQQMAFIVAGLYTLVWLAVISMRQVDAADAFLLVTFIYGIMISLLIGSLASAEERHLGTLEWHMTLPIATSRQWAIKVVTALVLTSIVALGMPALVAYVGQTTGLELGNGPSLWRLVFAPPMMLVTVGGLYVSSLCASGIQALLISVAAIPAVALFNQTVLVPLRWRAFEWASHLAGEVPGLGTRPGNMRFEIALALMTAGFVVLALRFALVNHRSADRDARRVWTQVIWMAACLTMTVMVWSALSGYLREASI